MGKQREDEFAGQKLPGTGGDFIDDNDVEGHRTPRRDDGAEGLLRRDGSDGGLRRDGDEVIRRYPDVEGDVEGHRRRDGAEELYRNLPTTQGEVIRRGPGDNPHGDR